MPEFRLNSYHKFCQMTKPKWSDKDYPKIDSKTSVTITRNFLVFNKVNFKNKQLKKTSFVVVFRLQIQREPEKTSSFRSLISVDGIRSSAYEQLGLRTMKEEGCFC